MYFYRGENGAGLAWGRWCVALCWGLPVCWLPRAERRHDRETLAWCVIWLLLAVIVMRYRRPRPWPVLRRKTASPACPAWRGAEGGRGSEGQAA